MSGNFQSNFKKETSSEVDSEESKIQHDSVNQIDIDLSVSKEANDAMESSNLNYLQTDSLNNLCDDDNEKPHQSNNEPDSHLQSGLFQPAKRERELTPPGPSPSSSYQSMAEAMLGSNGGTRINKKLKLSENPSDMEFENLVKQFSSLEAPSSSLLASASDDNTLSLAASAAEAQNKRNERKRQNQGERRNIHKITTKLKTETRKAEQAERSRIRRVAERNKMYKTLFPTSKTPDNSLVLDFDTKTNEVVISVDKNIVQDLKPHQEEGIKFLYENCFESFDMIKNNNNRGGGCILAHCMGLGKTLQAVAFSHTVLHYKNITGIETVLIVAPLNTIINWIKEFEKWLAKIEKEQQPLVHNLCTHVTCLGQRVNAFKKWKTEGGVGIISYDLFRNLIEPRQEKKKKGQANVKSPVPLRLEDKTEAEGEKQQNIAPPPPEENNQPTQDDIHRSELQTFLVQPGPDLIICDEGHLLKNANSKQSVALSKIATQRRIILTGTPLQNNLKEYHTMMQFVKPHLLGEIREFRNRFSNPIRNGQCKDSNPKDVSLMKKRAHFLHRKLEGCVQRLDHTVLEKFLLPKTEYCVFVRLTEMQKKLYKYYLDNFVKPGNFLKLSEKEKSAERRKFFVHYSKLVKIVAHPKILTLKKQLDNEESVDLETEEDGIEEDDEVAAHKEDSGNQTEQTDDEDDDDDDEDDDDDDDDGDIMTTNVKDTEAEVSNGKSSNKIPWKDQWFSKCFSNEAEIQDNNLSGKITVLQEIVKISESLGDKVLVFSQFLTTLNVIEDILEEWDKQDTGSRWRVGREYFRIDGSTRAKDRQLFCDAFNADDCQNTAKLCLISTKAGGLGINLHGANRVIMFDASWNPSNDMQSVFRVYRLGQLKPCYIYRLVAQGSIEEKIYNRQVVKLSLASRVVDKHQIKRHFKFEDLDELYKFDPDSPSHTQQMSQPDDQLLRKILTDHKEWVHKYLQHDSLLVNKVDEKLTPEEQKAAEEEFNSECD